MVDKKKVVKKVLKRVPGPIGSVARLSDMPRKVANAVKNTRTLKKMPKRKPGAPRMILGKVPKGINMSQKQYDTMLGNTMVNAIKKGKAIRTKKEIRGKGVATTQNVDRVRYGKKIKPTTKKAGILHKKRAGILHK